MAGLENPVEELIVENKQMSEAFCNSLFLALSGGFQDAYTYNSRGKVFSNAQTGNVVLMSQHFMEGRWQEGIRYLLPLLAFAVGVFIAERIQYRHRYAKRLHWRQGILLAEIAILFIVGFMPEKWNLPATIMVGPVTLWLILLVAVPLIYILVMSFCSIDQYYNVTFQFTFDNYKHLVDSSYIKIYVQSLVIALLTTVICIVLAYPFTYIIARTKSRSKNLLYMLVIIPFWTNSLIRIYGWKTFLGSSGWLNTVLMKLHLISEPLNLLYNQGTTVFGMVYCLFPFMVLPLYTAIGKLDHTLLEASSDLGAKGWRTFFEVILPLTASGIFSGCIMVFIPCLGYFFVSNILGGGNADVIGNLIERQFKSGNNWPLGAALSIILIVVTLILVKLYQKTGGDMDSLGV